MATTVPIAKLKSRVGQEIGLTDWQTIDQKRIDLFAEATGDNQYIHVDPERAVGSPFGGTIAHGLLNLSLVPAALLEHALEPEGTAMGLNYGYDEVRFLMPVKTDSEVRVRFAIDDVSEEDGKHGKQVKVTYDVKVEVKGSEKPAIVAKNIAVYIIGETAA